MAIRVIVRASRAVPDTENARFAASLANWGIWFAWVNFEQRGGCLQNGDSAASTTGLSRLLVTLSNFLPVGVPNYAVSSNEFDHASSQDDPRIAGCKLLHCFSGFQFASGFFPRLNF